MRGAFKVIAYVLAAEVVVQAMGLAYGLAGLVAWVEDGNDLTKAVLDDENADITGLGGFILHGMNGMMIIPLIALVLLIVSFFAKVEGGVRRAAILLGLVALQVFLGLTAHEAYALAPVHALNAFGIFTMALLTARSVTRVEEPAA